MIGDHTDLQVLTTRPNGVLVTENRSKGLRFTRVRLVIGPGKEGVVYKTADFHKPWTIGVTPDAGDPGQDRRPERAARADPQHVGSASRPTSIPRADAVRAATDGRLCESLVGNSSRTRCATYADRHRLRDHQLGRPPGRPDVPGDGSGGRLLPGVRRRRRYPITLGQSMACSVRELRRDADRERSGAEGDARERRFRSVGAGPAFTAVRAGTLPAGLGALLHLRHRGAARQSGHAGCWGRRRQLHGHPVGLTAAATYTIARTTSPRRGRRLPELGSRMTTQEHHGGDLADYVTANSPLYPAVKAARTAGSTARTPTARPRRTARPSRPLRRALLAPRRCEAPVAIDGGRCLVFVRASGA